MNTAATTGTQTAGASATAAASKARKDAMMGKDQFLTLLLAQLKNQDPLSPMDNTEFTAQMAQFSSLEQLFSVNDNLVGLQTLSSSLNNTQALNIIGKEIEANGNSIHVGSGIASDISYELPFEASAVTVSVLDKDGNVIRSLEQGHTRAGKQTIKWDAKDHKGNPVPAGIYAYSVNAVDGNGTSIDASTYTRGLVTGISMVNGITQLHVGGNRVMMGDVNQITEPGASQAKPKI